MRHIIKIHSFIDLITNSSTELFVGTTTKSIDFIKEVLQEILTSLSKLNDIDDEEYTNIDNIMSISLIDSCNIDSIIEDLLSWERIPWYCKNIERFDPPDINYSKYDESERNYNNYIEEWKNRNVEKLKESLIGSIIIEGTSDNSIPYQLFDIIEHDALDKSTRIHKG